MYVCGVKPFREHLLMPICRRFTYETVRKFLYEQKKKKLPSKKSGSFHAVYGGTDKQIIVYKFTNSVGCSTVGSSNHANLPHILRDLQTTPITMPASDLGDLGLGRAYLFPDSTLQEDAYGYHKPSTVQDRNIRYVVETAEATRKRSLIQKMKDTFPSLYVSEWGGIENHCCEFSGGGDVMCCPNNNSDARKIFCIYLPQWIKSSTVEVKYTHCSVDALELQLQANMVLLSSKCLFEVLTQNHEVDKVTIYGLGFGVFHKLLLLELNIDYVLGSLKFIELYSSPPNPSYHLSIDSAFRYVEAELLKL